MSLENRINKLEAEAARRAVDDFESRYNLMLLSDEELIGLETWFRESPPGEPLPPDLEAILERVKSDELRSAA